MEYVIIQSPNTHPWKLHFKKNLANTNLLAFHILCWNEKKIHNIHANQEIYTPLFNKFHILSCFNEHGTMIIYAKIRLLS
jgi:hypothetical protein